ncbi:glutathione S-transferase family protein [Dyella choica]|uniref:Glutathione S-transferase family protein n=1 Tax=Dyella choica TaxID=1927959 RepID=A0A3S0PNW0_9GAMM|nr:glutathione S-transferase family protein [Dyella choica]RUL77744.1 glutathione S-transferase family protein [Dyella choica]
MKLLYQTHSPYARKALVAVHEIGLAGRLEVIHHETSPLLRNDEIFALNPLGKVPVLICDDGAVLFDSNVICEYLDSMHGGHKLIPADPARRYLALRNQAIATGIADAGIAVRWESERRPEAVRWAPLREGQLQKIVAACDFLEQQIEQEPSLDIGAIALATTLSWIEFRDVYAFQQARPRLSSWYARFCERRSMQATALHGDTVDTTPSADRHLNKSPRKTTRADWLFLRGHVIPTRLAWQPDDPSRQAPTKQDARWPWSRSRMDRALVALRQCLGIGDGSMRKQ